MKIRKSIKSVAAASGKGFLLPLLFLIVLVLSGSIIRAQSYYFFVNDIHLPGNVVYNYKTLLTLQPDGSATARIQYNKPATGELYLYELQLTDTVIGQSSDTVKYLVCLKSFSVISEQNDSAFVIPRFVFTRRYDSTGYYYIPVAAEAEQPDGKWVATAMLTNEQKTFEQLRNDEPFVSAFYFDTEDFYQYLFDERTRAIPTQRSEKMYLIIVADTKDRTVGQSTKTDMANISSLFTTLARDLGNMQVVATYISGDNFNKMNVERAIKNLKPSAADIVIFYYSGHGYRMPGDDAISAYSRISFRTDENRRKKEVGDNLLLESIYNQIRALKPKLTLVLGDCCNANIYQNPVVGGDMIKPRGGGILGNFNLANAQKLFLPAVPTSIIIGSVKKDHLAVGHPEIGGYYTHFLTAELKKNLWGYSNSSFLTFGGQSNSNWLKIITDASQNTYNKAIRKQCGATENDRCVQRAEFKYPFQ